MRVLAVALVVLVGPGLAAGVRPDRPVPGPEPPTQASEAPADPLAERAEAIAAQVLERPELDADLFHPSFLEAVSRLRLRSILRGVHGEVGAVAELVPLGRDGRFHGRFLARGAAGKEVVVTVGVAPTPPHRITTLFLGPPTPSVTTWEGWAEALAELPGETAFALCALPEGPGAPAAAAADGGLRPLQGRNAETPLAVGSAFKLWVLGALAREVTARERSWADVTHLVEPARSVPSGDLQDWPVGAPVTLWTLAATMIAKSDNTATDHLIRLLGRGTVEDAVRAMGCAAAERNVPFLTTRELFLLKTAAGGALAEAFLARDAAGRRAYLDEAVAALPLDAIDQAALVSPNRIEEIEWFASPLDLCRAMADLRSHAAAGDAALGELLAINPGVRLGADLFAYLGFKGGSEPGVINLTFLVRTRDVAGREGGWHALALTWNDPERAVDEARFVGLAQKALLLLALGEG